MAKERRWKDDMMVRLPKDLHHQCKIAAAIEGKSIKQWLVAIVRKELWLRETSKGRDGAMETP